VTGYYSDQNKVAHGFIRGADGTIIVFDPDTSTSTEAMSINDKGEVTGSCECGKKRQF
jgi:hypothetical protein